MSWKKTLVVALTSCTLGCVVTRAYAEPQPRMRAALNHLEAALGELRSANHDKGGHRVRAIELTEQAIGQVRQGIGFDNRN